jgi:hypothetical protein
MPMPKKGPGRPAGSKNKRTLALTEKLSSMGAHPEVFLAEVMLGNHDCLKGLTPFQVSTMRRGAARDLMPFVHPKQMAVDFTGTMDFGPVTLTIVADDRPGGVPPPDTGD